MRRNPARLLIVLALLCAPWLGAQAATAEDDILRPEEAFRFSFEGAEDGRLRFGWQIADGYYLYRKAFRFQTAQAGVVLEPARFPPGERRHDEFFGESEIYRGPLGVEVPYRSDATAAFAVEVVYQGCADLGICYPPERKRVEVRPEPAVPAAGGRGLQGLFGGDAGGDELLPEERAFGFEAEAVDGAMLRLDFHIAEGYYLYRDQIRLRLEGEGVRLGPLQLPSGIVKDDPEYGPVQVYTSDLHLDVPVLREGTSPQPVILTADFQGCEERRGVCYPPMQRRVALELPSGSPAAPAMATLSPPAAGTDLSETERIAGTLHGRALGWTLASFFGFGLLLAFTPCVFPMVPILSGIIVGQGASGMRAFTLSAAYVLASALAYTVFGLLAGTLGGNLQAALQAPAVLVVFSLLFVALALSMFGLYELQLPLSWQERLARLSRRQHGGQHLGVALMGALSALIVGPCVAAPLAGALLYIGQAGDPVRGGLALFVMGLGMGAPLLLLGASAGRWLPRAGVWMKPVKAVFGVALLAVAVWLLARVLPGPLIMVLWGLLLIVPAIFLGALDGLPAGVSGWRRLGKGTGIAMLAWGVLVLAGAAGGGDDPLQPLRGLALRAGPAQPGLAFQRVRDLGELEAALAAAGAAGRPVMLDFYADWCISCKEMERDTFGHPEVQAVLAGFTLLQADVTANQADDRALLRRFDLVGPPATLFFGVDGSERRAQRVIGFVGASEFLTLLHKVRS